MSKLLPRRRAACLFLGLLLTCGCTPLPPPQEWGRDERRALAGGARLGERGESWAREEPRTPEASGPAQPARARGGAPETLEEPLSRLTLEDALRLARERSPTLARARRRIERARALVNEAEAGFYPTLDARASWVRFLEAAQFRGRTGTDVSGSTTRARFFTGRGSDIYNAGVEAGYTVFDGGVSYYGRRAALHDFEAARLDERSAAETLEADVTLAFLDAVLSDGEIQIAREALDLARSEQALAEARRDAGEGLELDVLRFRARVAEARLALNQARNNRRVRLAVLAELLGTRIDENAELVPPEKGLPVPEENLVGVALENRPELRALDSRLLGAADAIRREKATFLPSVRVFGSYGVLSLDDIKVSNREDEFLVGASLSLNLFEGGATAARIARLRSEYAELAEERTETALRVEREVLESEAALTVARQNVEVAAENVALAEEVLRQITTRYREGEAQVVDVNEAQLGLTRARLAHLRSRVGLLAAQVRLLRSLGLGLAAFGERAP